MSVGWKFQLWHDKQDSSYQTQLEPFKIFFPLWLLTTHIEDRIGGCISHSTWKWHLAIACIGMTPFNPLAGALISTFPLELWNWRFIKYIYNFQQITSPFPTNHFPFSNKSLPLFQQITSPFPTNHFPFSNKSLPLFQQITSPFPTNHFPFSIFFHPFPQMSCKCS
jgi:hypothetical protein